MALVSEADLLYLQKNGLSLDTLHQEDLEAWFDHLALVFDKTGRGYFVDHFHAQPDLESILVIKHIETGLILSTMRIFDQHITLGVRQNVF